MSSWVPVAAAMAPLVLPGLWLAAWLRSDRRGRVLAAAAATVVLAAAVGSRELAIYGSSYVAAGLLGGWAWQRGARVAAVLAVMVLATLPTIVAALDGATIAANLDAMRDVARTSFAHQLPATATEAQREAWRAEFARQIDGVVRIMTWIWPSFVVLGQVTVAAVGLIAGLWLARRKERIWRPVRTWAVPAATVWVLAVGLGLVLVGSHPLRLAGVNMALLATLALAVQGTAVQVWYIGKVLPGPLRVVYWLMMTVLFWPVVIAGGAAIGLVDQWLDLRRHHGAIRED